MAGKWMRKVRLRLHNGFSVQSVGRSVSHPICTSPQVRFCTANEVGGLTSQVRAVDVLVLIVGRIRARLQLTNPDFYRGRIRAKAVRIGFFLPHENRLNSRSIRTYVDFLSFLR